MSTKNTLMPSSIKNAMIVLVFSLVSALIGAYFDGIEVDELGFDDPITLVLNFIWAITIAWIIWDLYRARSIKWTLIIVGVIMLTSLVWNYLEFGASKSQVFYLIELLMFAVAYFFTSTKSAKGWFKQSGH